MIINTQQYSAILSNTQQCLIKSKHLNFSAKNFAETFKHCERIFLSEILHLHWRNLYCCFEDHSVELDLAEYPRSKVRLLSHPSEAPRLKRKAKPLSRPPLSFWTLWLCQCHLIGVQTTCFSWSTTQQLPWPGRCVASFASHPTLPVALCTVQRTTQSSSWWKWENSVGLHSVWNFFEYDTIRAKLHFNFYPF